MLQDKGRHIKIGTWNCRGFNSQKQFELNHLLSINKIDILILNETYTGGDDGLLHPKSNYSIIFNKSNSAHTAGVAIVYNNKIFNKDISTRMYTNLNTDRTIYTK